MLNLILNSSYDKKLPSGFSTSFTVTTPLSSHDFQNKVALSMVTDLLFQRMNSPFRKMLAVFLRSCRRILKKFSIEERQTCFQEFYAVIIAFEEK